jgi:hypothetical protein
MIIDLIGFSIIAIIVGFFTYKYWDNVIREFNSNIKTRFFSIVLGILSTAFLFFIIKLIATASEKWKLDEYLVKNDFLSLGLKVGFTVIITAILIIIYRAELRERAVSTLDEMNARYKELSGHSIAFFNQVFKFRDSIEENNILRFVLKNYSEFGESGKFVISLNTYFDIVTSFLKQGYRLTSVNSTLIPFWYAPITTDESVLEYTNYFKAHEKEIMYCRVTYYQNDDWKKKTVGMIYNDLINSEHGIEYTITWLVTLLSNIPFAHGEIMDLLEIEEGVNYLKQPSSNRTIQQVKKIADNKSDLERLNKYVSEKSAEMTNSVMEKFKESMGVEGCYSCSKTQFEDKFGKIITEIGYFEKGDSVFAVNLLGKISDSITLQIISDKEDLKKIKNKIIDLKHSNA